MVTGTVPSASEKLPCTLFPFPLIDVPPMYGKHWPLDTVEVMVEVTAHCRHLTDYPHHIWSLLDLSLVLCFGDVTRTHRPGSTLDKILKPLSTLTV